MQPAPANTLPRPSLSVWLELILLGAIWGGSFFFAKIAVAEIPPILLVLLRVSIAAAALLAVFLVLMRAELMKALARWPEFLVIGLLNNIIPFSLIFIGQTEIGAGLAAIINATTPLWTALAANALTADDRLSGNRIAGILVGLAGAIVMIGVDALAGIGGPVWPKLAIVGATISYAFAVVFARRFRDLKPQAIATGQLTASTVLMIPIATVATGFAPLASASGGVWQAVLALALLSTAFAYILYFDIINKAGATNASLVTLIVPPFAILLGAVFLSERLLVHEIAGMALIVIGLILFDGRALRAFFSSMPKA